MVRAFSYGVLQRDARWDPNDRPAVVSFFVETMIKTIEDFLSARTNKMVLQLENIENDFVKFWNRIGGTGDLDLALSEWTRKNNPSPKRPILKQILRNAMGRVIW